MDTYKKYTQQDTLKYKKVNFREPIVGGDHRSKYRVDVNAPGRQENPVFRSANIFVAPPFFVCLATTV